MQMTQGVTLLSTGARESSKSADVPVIRWKLNLMIVERTALKILLQPLPLLIGRIFRPVAVDGSKWPAVSNEGLVLGWEPMIVGIPNERPLRAVWEVRLAVNGDKMG